MKSIKVEDEKCFIFNLVTWSPHVMHLIFFGLEDFWINIVLTIKNIFTKILLKNRFISFLITKTKYAICFSFS